MRTRILSQSTTTVNEYCLEIGPMTYYYKEYLNDKGKVIDDELIEEDGRIHKDEGVLKIIREAVDRHQQK